MTDGEQQRRTSPTQSVGWVGGLVGIGIASFDIFMVYVMLAGIAGMPAILSIGLTALVAVLILGSVLLVLVRPPDGRGSQDADKPRSRRVAEVTVAVTIMTLVTAIAGSIGLILLLVAQFRGTVSTSEQADSLADRLLGWFEQNKEFIRQNGRGTLPLRPEGETQSTKPPTSTNP